MGRLLMVVPVEALREAIEVEAITVPQKDRGWVRAKLMEARLVPTVEVRRRLAALDTVVMGGAIAILLSVAEEVAVGCLEEEAAQFAVREVEVQATLVVPLTGKPLQVTNPSQHQVEEVKLDTLAMDMQE